MWKTKKRIAVSVLIGVVVLVILYMTIQLPEDQSRSLGNSATRTQDEMIDNYGNVHEYSYGAKVYSFQTPFYLKNIPFSFWEEIKFSKDYYLQGICFVNEYVLVSAYREGDDVLGEIMVYNRHTGEHCLSLGMDGKSHLGGLAFDGEYIWVCNSANNTIEQLSYQVLLEIIRNHQGELVVITNLVSAYPVHNTPSSVSYYNGRLWVITHSKWGVSVMSSYRYVQYKDILKWEGNYKIPSRVQDIIFDDEGRVYASCSYGRQNSSYLRIYSSVECMNDNIYADTAIVEMPPCSEGMAIYENQLYILFESAGEKYYLGTDGLGRSLSPLDKILIINLQKTDGCR